jgi:precorrin-2 dehydrogenase / sirohydrochlorin ferrochelatase
VSSKPSRSAINPIYYPVFLDISGKPCLVVGGGNVAERKVRILLKFGAHVKVVSPKLNSPLTRLAEKGRIEVVKREYEGADLEGTALIFAATNNEETNAKVRKDGAQRRIPVNVVDNPALCDFIVPAIVKKGPIVIAVSTSGTLPMLSKKLRKEVEALVTGDYMRYLSMIGTFRKHLIEKVKDKKRRSDIMKEIAKMGIKELNNLGLKGIEERFLGGPP